MSLRVRQAVLSTLTMGFVYVLFGVLFFVIVRHFMYQAIDDSIERQSAANLAYLLLRPGGDVTQINSNNSIGTVFFTVIDSSGRVVTYDRQVPFSDAQFSRALDGETVRYIETLHDDTRVRIVMQPIHFSPDGRTVGVLLAASPLSMADQMLNDLKVLLFATGALLLVSAAAGSYFITGRTLRAVERVTQKARQIEVSQDLAQRIPEPTHDDEVGHLINTFNRMLSRLHSAFEAQRRFVADSSHELRTPLTVIRSNLHLMRRASAQAELTELYTVTEAEVDRLNRMVNDLLYMAQVQAGYTVQPVLRPVELESLLLETFARARAMAATRHQRVILVHEDIATTLGDADQLQHLLINLIDNAVKYTPPGGTIGLGLWRDANKARIEVRDSGPGIPPQDLPHIFERFYRTQSARDTVRSGSGLGLAIVKSIAEANGAEVDVASRPGEGTTFILLLPLQRQSALPTRAAGTRAPSGAAEHGAAATTGQMKETVRG